MERVSAIGTELVSKRRVQLDSFLWDDGCVCLCVCACVCCVCVCVSVSVSVSVSQTDSQPHTVTFPCLLTRPSQRAALFPLTAERGGKVKEAMTLMIKHLGLVEQVVSY